MTITKNVWKAAALLLILCLVSAVMISGTYAKYTSEYAGQDTALVAKWSIVATGGGITMQDGATAAHLNLFNHTLSNIATSTGGMYIVAPGADGQFTLEFQNNSDVNAAVSFSAISVSGTANGVPIEYSVDGGTNYVTAAGLQTALNGIAAFQDIAPNSPAVTQNVLWQWPYSVDTAHDVADTLIGTTSAINAGTTYRLNITATAIQLEPGL